MLTYDPTALARRQLALDRERVKGFPELFDHKVARMAGSPLALLRGAAPLFYEVLAKHPALAEGPPGDGWLVGDAHLENFGAYRTGAGGADAVTGGDAADGQNVVFDLNDFDEAFVGPLRLDVLRLLTSLLLGGREMGADGQRALALVDALLAAYAGALFGTEKRGPPPPVVARLVSAVAARTRRELLDARTTVAQGERRFVRGSRYRELDIKVRGKAEKAFATYAAAQVACGGVAHEALKVVDAAFRVAGTGSLGGLRVAVLTHGKGGRDGAWVFDMKAQGAPSAAPLVKPPAMDPATRVCTALGACLEHPPRMVGTTSIDDASIFVRRLSPQEDKLDLTKLSPADLEPLARHLGALLGAAHRRGQTRAPAHAWTKEEQEALVANAIALAGLHEATYLAYCNLVRA